jgi:hypothetical protein
MEVERHAFLALALDGDEWSSSRPGRFIPRETDPGSQWIGGLVSMDAVEKRKILSPRWESNPESQ